MRAKALFYTMIAVAVIALASSGGLFYITNQKLEKTVADISKREADIALADLEIENLSTLEKELSRIADVKSEIEAALPKGKTQSEGVAQILDIAAANGINIRSLTFEATEGLPAENSQTETSPVLPAVSTVPISIDTGSIPYDTLKNFLRDVLAIRRNANVRTLSLSRDAEVAGHVVANITIDIHLEKVAENLTEAEKAQRRKELEQQTQEEQQ